MANTKVTTNVIANSAITVDHLHSSLDLSSKTLSATTQSASDNTTKVATTAYVTTAIDNLIDSAPGTMNTLNEIAAAINDDANFNTTVTNLIASKLPLAGGSLTGNLLMRNGGNIELGGYNSGNDKGLILSPQDGSGYWHVYNTAGGHLAFGASNTIGSSEKMRIAGSGNVGIGTISPDLNLHVDGTNGYPATSGTTPNGMVHLRSKTAGSSHGLYMGVSNVAPWGSWLQSADAGNLATEYPLLLNPNGGNVGIGNTSASTLLHITGSGDAIRVESTNTGTGGAQVDLLHFTTSPADNDIHAMINMGGYTSGTSSAYGSSIRSVWTDVSAKEAQLEFFTRDDADFTARMIIDKDGNVGIGGTPHASGRLLVTNGGTNQVVLKGASGTTNLNMGNFVGGGYISNNYYYSSGHQADDNSKDAFEVFIGDANYGINFHSAGSMGTRRRDFHITDTGKVGMGTNNPQAKLHITGQGGSTSPTLTLASDTSTTFNHSINALNPYLAANENNLLVVGKAGSTKDAGYIGYKWKAAGSNSNILTLGHWGHNNIVNIDGKGNTGFGIESPFHSKQKKSEITVTTAITSNAHSVNAGSNGGYDVSNDEGLVAWSGMKAITTGGHYNKPVLEMRIIGNMAANTWYPIATMSQLTNWCGDTNSNEYNGFSMYFRIYTYDTGVGGGEYLGSRMSERIWVNAYTCNSVQRQTLHVGAAWGHAPNNGQTAAGSGPYQLSIKHHYNTDSYYPAVQTLEFLTTAAKTGLNGSGNANITIYGHVG